MPPSSRRFWPPDAESVDGAIRMPVGSGYFVQCFLWGVLAGIGLIILGTVLVASGGVGVLGGVPLIAIGFVLPVLGGWASASGVSR